MNAEVKAKWLEALRSGKYKQGQGRLRSRDNKFCCLGVLEDVLETPWTLKGTRFAVPDGGIPDAYSGTLSPNSQVRCGISLHAIDHLTALNDGINNDGVGETFSVIADYIEANL